ncbi:hypothetical protein HYH03_017679 [Edaphochlamys debaryana]|uniref:Guanylate cyclase domain-containing protein n=1 Tax=Edaphochlamys debaryana TaxID=47281 RepID=A0A835XG35_9CHLO|nr:hypothetical protein HYH03_017679 [Edaphochlamys debaryana]|eukprot:KAG2483423.1 hypothetical protein HYH03_017679 [Edaphochlamys debaryana]
MKRRRLDLRICLLGVLVATLGVAGVAAAEDLALRQNCSLALASYIKTNSTILDSWTSTGFAASVSMSDFIAEVLEAEDGTKDCRRPANTPTALITWLQYPGWISSLMCDAFFRSNTGGAMVEMVTMPPPAAVGGPQSMVDYQQINFGHHGVTTADMSALSPTYASFNNQFPTYPENSCLDLTTLAGSLHPRVFLLLFYRPAALAALASAGATASAAPPDSWTDLIAALEAHRRLSESPQGASLGLPRHGLCVTTDPSCGRAGDLLAAVAASIGQTLGTATGYAFDLRQAPPTVESRVRGPSWRRAVDVVRQLMSYNAPPEGDLAASASALQRCRAVHPAFTSGDCMITMEWDTAWWILLADGASANGRGPWAVAPLPGSEMVEPPPASSSAAAHSTAVGAVDGLVPCTLETCAISANHDLLYQGARGRSQQATAASVAAAGEAAEAAEAAGKPLACGLPGMAAVAAAAAAAVRRVTGARSSAAPKLVNRAPYSALFMPYIYLDFTVLARLNAAEVTAATEYAVADLLITTRQNRQNSTNDLRVAMGYGKAEDAAAAAAVSMATVTARAGRISASGGNATAWDGPTYVRTPWWTANTSMTKELESVGLDREIAQSYLAAIWHALHHPNGAPDIQGVVIINWFKWALSYTAYALVPPERGGAGPPLPTDNATALLGQWFGWVSSAFGPGTVRRAYELSILAPAWQAPLPPVSDSSGGDSVSVGTIVGIAVGVGVGSLLLLLLAALVVWRLGFTSRGLLGGVRAPRPGPDTTLLVTDVQNGTLLWEALPAASCMDPAMRMHHATLRQLCARHDGYESAVEGDSFVIAFASPAKAAAFASAAQVALLGCPWPPELLAHPDGAAVIVEPAGRAGSGRAGGVGGSLHGLQLSPVAAARLGLPMSPTGASAPSAQGVDAPPKASSASQHLSKPLDCGPPCSDELLGGVLPSPTSVDYAAADAVALQSSSGSEAESEGEAASGPEKRVCRTWAAVLAAEWRVVFAGVTNSQTSFSASMSSSRAAPGPDPAVRLQPGQVLVFRGLRVRMGIHSGLEGQQGMSYNKMTRTWRYHGFFARAATLVSAAAPGGMVLLSAEAFARLRAAAKERRGHGGADVGGASPVQPHAAEPGSPPSSPTFSRDLVVLYAGHFVLPELYKDTATALLMSTDTEGAGAAFVHGSAHSQTAAWAQLAGRTEHDPRSPSQLAEVVVDDGSPPASQRGRRRGGQGSAMEAPAFVVSPAGEGAEQAAEAEEEESSANTQEGIALYQAVPPSLRLRLVLSQVLRNVRCVQLGTLTAPTGYLCVAVMKVVGAATLLSDLPGPASRALSTFRAVASRRLARRDEPPPVAVSARTRSVAAMQRDPQLARSSTPRAVEGRPAPAAGGGYLVESGEGLVVAVFPTARAALEWSLNCLEALARVDWDEELLGHELCEEVLSVGYAGPPALVRSEAEARADMVMAGSAVVVHKVLDRGLRVKVGMDLGVTTTALAEATGRLSYSGRPMNRAARIAGRAAAGQVLCSSIVWRTCQHELEGVHVPGRPLVGMSVGRAALRGIPHPVELVQCLRRG